MYDNRIYANKNVTTTIGLEVKLPNRKAVQLNSDMLFYFNVMTKDGERYAIRKQFDISELSYGRLRVNIEPEDIDLLETGLYTYSVTYIKDTNEKLLYVNDGYHSEIEITDSAMAVIRPPYVQINFTNVRTVRDNEIAETIEYDLTKISSRLPIRRDNHQILLTLTNFRGKVIIERTTDRDPDDQSSWTPLSETFLDNVTGDELFELVGVSQFKYLRVKMISYKESTGKVDKLEYT